MHALRRVFLRVVAVCSHHRVCFDGSLRPQQLKNVLASSQQMKTLVDDILDINKLRAGKLEIRSTLFSMVDLVQDAAAQHVGFAKVPITTTIANDVPAIVKAPNVRIRQVVNNGFTNACKFTKYGYINISLALAAKPDRLRVEISNTGQGLGTDDPESLFEAYTQGNNQDQTTSSGTGLGLPICRTLTKKMDGIIGLKDVMDGDQIVTVFFFEVPFEPVDGEAAERAANVVGARPTRSVSLSSEDEEKGDDDISPSGSSQSMAISRNEPVAAAHIAVNMGTAGRTPSNRSLPMAASATAPVAARAPAPTPALALAPPVSSDAAPTAGIYGSATAGPANGGGSDGAGAGTGAGAGAGAGAATEADPAAAKKAARAKARAARNAARAERRASGKGRTKSKKRRAELGLHVLLVDDEEVNRDVGQVYLDRLGCTFTCLEVRQCGWRVVVGAACV